MDKETSIIANYLIDNKFDERVELFLLSDGVYSKASSCRQELEDIRKYTKDSDAIASRGISCCIDENLLKLQGNKKAKITKKTIKVSDLLNEYVNHVLYDAKRQLTDIEDEW